MAYVINDINNYYIIDNETIYFNLDTISQYLNYISNQYLLNKYKNNIVIINLKFTNYDGLKYISNKENSKNNGWFEIMESVNKIITNKEYFKKNINVVQNKSNSTLNGED